MTKEWQIVEAQRDGSHEFCALTAEAETNCSVCGKPRWAHVFDGFRPTPMPAPGRPTPSALSTDPGLYRGPHPAWTRPGSFSQLERAELAAQQRSQRAEIERVINEDRAKFKARSRP